MTTWDEWHAAPEVRASELQPGDSIIAHPDSGPFGPWVVEWVDVHPATRQTKIKLDSGDMWFRRGTDNYRIECAS